MFVHVHNSAGGPSAFHTQDNMQGARGKMRDCECGMRNYSEARREGADLRFEIS